MSVSQQRHRRTIAKGIYADQWGLAAKVQANGLTREKRFPPDTKPQDDQELAGRHEGSIAETSPRRSGEERLRQTSNGILQAVRRCQRTKSGRHTWRSGARSLARATDTRIETLEIDTVLSRWLEAGLQPSTVRNRRTALQALWTGLDGKAAPNPVREALMPVLAQPEARAIPYKTIAKILDAMPDVGQGRPGEARDDQSKTKARLAVIAYTGLPHALIKKLTPEAINWRTKTVAVPARKKGKGAAGRILPVTAEGLKPYDVQQSSSAGEPSATVV